MLVPGFFRGSNGDGEELGWMLKMGEFDNRRVEAMVWGDVHVFVWDGDRFGLIELEVSGREHVIELGGGRLYHSEVSTLGPSCDSVYCRQQSPTGHLASV